MEFPQPPSPPHHVLYILLTDSIDSILTTMVQKQNTCTLTLPKLLISLVFGFDISTLILVLVVVVLSESELCC